MKTPHSLSTMVRISSLMYLLKLRKQHDKMGGGEGEDTLDNLPSRHLCHFCEGITAAALTSAEGCRSAAIEYDCPVWDMIYSQLLHLSPLIPGDRHVQLKTRRRDSLDHRQGSEIAATFVRRDGTAVTDPIPLDVNVWCPRGESFLFSARSRDDKYLPMSKQSNYPLNVVVVILSCILLNFSKAIQPLATGFLSPILAGLARDLRKQCNS